MHIRLHEIRTRATNVRFKRAKRMALVQNYRFSTRKYCKFINENHI